jgi:hypothetical protein
MKKNSQIHIEQVTKTFQKKAKLKSLHKLYQRKNRETRNYKNLNEKNKIKITLIRGLCSLHHSLNWKSITNKIGHNSHVVVFFNYVLMSVDYNFLKV